MQVPSWLIGLNDLESIIDHSPLIVTLETGVSEAIALMATENKTILVQSGCEIVGCLTNHHIIQLIASDANLHTLTVAQVMQTPIKILSPQEIDHLGTIFLLLQKQDVKIIVLVDQQKQVIGTVTPESVFAAVSATQVQCLSDHSTLEKLRLLESVVVNANDAILITDAQTLDEPNGPRIVYANAAFTAISGYTAEEIIGKTPRFLQGEKTSHTQLNQIRVALERGLSVKAELANYHKNGSIYWVEVNIVPITNLVGKITHFVSIQRDITEYKLTEEALRLNEELFIQLTENIPQVFFVCDAEVEKLYYVSSAFETIWQRSREHLYVNLDNFYQSLHPFDCDRFHASLAKLKTGHPFDEEYRIIRPNREVRWINCKIFPVRNQAEKIYRYTGLFEDITERKLYFEVLRESEKRFNYLADTAPVLIWMSGEDALCNFVNQTWLEFTGSTLEQELGNGWLANVHPDDIQTCLDTYFSAFGCHERFSIEYRLKRFDGEYRWLLDTGVPRFTTNGQFMGYIGSCIDITARKQAFEELQESNARLTLALEATNTIYWEWNLQTNEVMFLSTADNKGTIQKMSYSQALTCIHPEDIDKLTQATDAAIANHSGIEIEYRSRLNPDASEYKWLLSRAQVLSDSTGKPDRFIGVALDIHHRIQSENALRENERRFRAIFNGAFQCTAILTPEGIVLEANQTCLELGEIQPEEIVGQPLWDMKWWKMNPATQERLKVAIATAAQGEFVRYELDILRNQQIRTIDFSIKPLKNETDQVILLIAESRDIHDLKQAQAALEQYNHELEKRVVERTTALQAINEKLISEISDRQKIEEQLLQSQQMLQLIMDTIPHCIFWKDRNSVYLGCNRYFAEKIAGVKHPEEIIGKSDYDLFSDNQEAEFHLAGDIWVINTNQPEYHIIRQYIKNDNQQIWLEANKVPLHDADSNVVGILGTYEDITARQQAQEQLAKSEERFRFLAEAIPQQVWIAQADGNIEYVNNRILNFFGCSLDQILGWKWQALVHPEDWSASLTAWNKSLRTGETYQVEFRLLEKQTGQYRWHLARAFPLRDRQGKVISWFGTNTDIDDRVSAEVALRESERRYHTIATVSPVGLFRANSKGYFLYVNERWCELTGTTAEAMMGMGWLSFLHPEDLSRVSRDWYQAVQHHQIFRAEYRFQRPDGKISWVLGQAVPERTETGEIIAYVGTVTDISERKRAETALAERVRLADFRAEVDAVLTQQETLESMMRGCTEAVVKHLGAAFARIWLLNPATQILELQVSSGMYIHIDGDHGRISVGQYKIGLIAQTGRPLLTNFVSHDSRIHDQEWVKREGIVSFVGYPLIVESKILGVIAMFSRQTLAESTFAAMGIAADEIAIGIKRKQTEAALRESEERFRNLVEASSDWVWEVDENAVFTYISPQVRDILGYEAEEVLGKKPLDLMPQDQIHQIGFDFASIFTHPQPFQCLDNRQIHRDGHIVILETSGIPVFDADGKFRGYRGMSRDVTQRYQAAAALQETQQRLQAILDNTSAVMYVTDTENRYILVNSQYERLFNVTQEQLYGKSIFEVWSEDIANLFAKHNHYVITTGEPIEAEETVSQGGELHTYLTIKFPLKDANGVIYAVGGISTDITDRKLVEESLIRLHKAIESTSDAIAMSDITGQGIYVNPAFIELFEYNLEELQAAGGPAIIFKSPQEYEKILATIQAGESWRGEVIMQTRSGRSLFIYLRADAIKDTASKFLGIVNIYTDITQRKQAEEDLRLRDRAIAASRNAIIIADVTQTPTIIYVNSAFEMMTGYTAAEVIGRNFPSLPGADLDQPEWQQLSTAMAAGQDCTVILRQQRKDERGFWNELTISPVYDPDGYLTHYIGIQTDITERKQAETALLISQQRLHYLLSSSPATIYAAKTYGDYGTIFISENVTAMMGYTAREFLEDSSFWLNHIHREDVTQVLTGIAKVEEQGHYSLEYRFLHHDGSYRWVYDQGKIIKDQAGNPLELVGYWADITSRKQLEQDLRVALETEKELNELKSRFISMTSHEFRTPLSTILSSSELLEHYRHKWSQEKQLTHLHRIQTAVKRMTEMLNDVLVIGKAEAGKLEYRPTYFDLVEYCYQLVEEVRLNSDQHIITFSSQSASLPCYMDDKLLGHILSNLLSNAIKYSPNGGSVNFILNCENEQVRFEIQDQGIGIPEEDIPRLFETFHRAQNVGNIVGTGLGLAIVKKCVDIHQGQIYVKSITGIGTTFTITLPLNNQIPSEVYYA
ncbi:MAG TPA: PAS domain S-box protein [Nostocaceae cyanobacterium]|nr:PAS domain S-box protein [Nostocaceae cyanobacterium]